MQVEIDPDVRAVIEFMQSSMSAAKLVAVAEAVSALAPVLWGMFEPEGITALRLRSELISAAHAVLPQQDASEPLPGSPSNADGGFAVAAS